MEDHNNKNNNITNSIKFIQPLESRITTVYLPELPTFEDTNSHSTIEENTVSHDQCTVQVIPEPISFNFVE